MARKLSAANYFSKKGHNVTAIDSRANPPGLNGKKELSKKVGIYLETLDISWLRDKDLVIVSPGIEKNAPILTEAKNNEIDRVLNDEITPTLDKLRMEKANYLAYNGNATKVDEPTALFSPPLVHSLLLESTLKHRYLTHKIFHFCLQTLTRDT